MVTILKLKSLALFTTASALMALSAIANSQVYKYVDEEGNIVYSDSPPIEEPTMEPAELPEVIYQPAVDIPVDNHRHYPAAMDIEVDITSPANESTVPGSVSSFSVAGSTSRRLNAGETAQLMVNGTVHSQGASLGWSITDLVRGEYNLSIQILDDKQAVIAQSATTLVYVQRNIARP